MILGEVVGSVVSTIKDDNLVGQKLLLVQPIDTDGSPKGVTFIAIDRVSAGKGDQVLVNNEGGGTKIMYGRVLPIQAVIVGVIDEIAVTFGEQNTDAQKDTHDSGSSDNK